MIYVGMNTSVHKPSFRHNAFSLRCHTTELFSITDQYDYSNYRQHQDTALSLLLVSKTTTLFSFQSSIMTVVVTSRIINQKPYNIKRLNSKHLYIPSREKKGLNTICSLTFRYRGDSAAFDWTDTIFSQKKER